MYRHVSPQVKQATPMMCYAAALESWTAATPGYVQTSQMDIASDWGDPAINGGISEEKLLKLFNAYGLDYITWAKGLRDLTERLIAEQLKDGLVLLVYKSSVQNSHTLVIYGVSSDNGVAQISYMDPWYGDYRWANVDDFNGKPWLLAWKKVVSGD